MILADEAPPVDWSALIQEAYDELVVSGDLPPPETNDE